MTAVKPYGLTTAILHADRRAGVEHGALHKPLHCAAAFGYSTAEELVAVFQGRASGHIYARQGNPTTQQLEAKLKLMEDGFGAITFATGMAALSAVFLTLLRRGDHLVASRHLFGNTASLLGTLELLGADVTLVDAADAANVQAAVTPATRMVLVETIANPGTQVPDLEGIGQLCQQRGLVFVVDSTLTTPSLFRPKSVGASLVVHSLSKGISGHGDALGGAVIDTGVFNWASYPNIAEPYRKGDAAGWGLQQIRKKGLRDMGGTLSSEHGHRIASGATTLKLRMDQSCDTALRLAQWLEQQPGVAKVNYPGLPSHPQHARAAKLYRRFGTLFSLELSEGLDPLVFLNGLDVVIKSSHLGDARTLAIPVAHTIFWEMGAERRAAMGIKDGLVRVSVGLEDYEDLQADFAAGLAAARAG